MEIQPEDMLSDQETTRHSHEPSSIEDEEINLLDYMIILLRHKWLIITIVFIAGLAAVIVSLMMPDIYRSAATITPRQEEKSTTSALSALGGLGSVAGELVGLGGGGDVEKFEVILRSRELTRRVVVKYKLMPELFEDEWDPLKEDWKENPGPTLQDAYRLITESMLNVSREVNTDILLIRFDHEDPRFAKIMVENYLTELSESLREETLKDAAERKLFLEQQLVKISDPLLKVKVSDLLAKEIEKETLAMAQKYYSFVVLDPPVAADPDKKVRPKRSLFCIVSVIVAGFLAIFISFCLEYLKGEKNSKKEKKLSDLKKHLRLRAPKR